MRIIDIGTYPKYETSCGIGSVNCSYSKLVKLFGEPNDSGCYKSDYEWRINFDSGDHVFIYDWKVGKNYLGEEDGLEKEDITCWSIGGSRDSLSKIIENIVYGDNWNGFEKERLMMFMSEELAQEVVDRDCEE